MKMNDLASLLQVCQYVGQGEAGRKALEAFRPRPYVERIGGKTVASAGCVPILHMRDFSKNKALGDNLVEDMKSRKGRGSLGRRG